MICGSVDLISWSRKGTAGQMDLLFSVAHINFIGILQAHLLSHNLMELLATKIFVALFQSVTLMAVINRGYAVCTNTQQLSKAATKSDWYLYDCPTTCPGED